MYPHAPFVAKLVLAGGAPLPAGAIMGKADMRIYRFTKPDKGRYRALNMISRRVETNRGAIPGRPGIGKLAPAGGGASKVNTIEHPNAAS